MDIEADNKRHRREEEARRAKRKVSNEFCCEYKSNI